jgi:hypothetical protein
MLGKPQFRPGVKQAKGKVPVAFGLVLITSWGRAAAQCSNRKPQPSNKYMMPNPYHRV